MIKKIPNTSEILLLLLFGSFVPTLPHIFPSLISRVQNQERTVEAWEAGEAREAREAEEAWKAWEAKA